ncbi:hypothetical protein SDC9_102373 [bioreactor metagenome]|uniref:Uncharacterized protein n=1 Tax=bioreactor metagenome TaxID=1076179 RepID=A0A645ARP1_9ZZZZ
MGRPKKTVAMETRIGNAEQRVRTLKAQYDDALAELKALLEEQQRIHAEKLLKAIAKSGKSFDEVLRLIEL